jgi:hypothetical protein
MEGSEELLQSKLPTNILEYKYTSEAHPSTNPNKYSQIHCKPVGMHATATHTESEARHTLAVRHVFAQCSW